MDARADERSRPRSDGLGLTGRIALLALAIAALAAAIDGGLVRLGLPLQAPANAIAFHGALMVAGFLGTVIGLERAIALGSPFAFTAPLFAGIGTLATLAGWTAVAQVAWIAAPLLLMAVSAAIVRRQLALHTVLLTVAAGAWACASALTMAALAPGAVPGWWFAFLVLTIAAERLEMTRLMKRRALATPLFIAATLLLLLGATVSIGNAGVGGALYGAALAAIAAWLTAFDLARRTVRTEGFARYAAIALLTGYGWLVVAGVAWAAMPHSSLPLRDVAFHALGLGFVVSMIFAHAPVVVPVIARRAMRFSPFLYVPLALLHGSLLLRFAGAWEPLLRPWGGVLNAVTLIVFAAAIACGLRARSQPGADAVALRDR